MTGPRRMIARNVARAAISFFIVLVMALIAAGWVWTGRNQPPSQAGASHVVLALGALAGLLGLAAVWRPQ